MSYVICRELKKDNATDFGKPYVTKVVKDTTYSQLETDQAMLSSQVQEQKIQNDKMLTKHMLLNDQSLELQKTSEAIDEHRKKLLEENIKLNCKISTQHVVINELKSKLEESKTSSSKLNCEYTKILDELSTLKNEYSKLQLTQHTAYNQMLTEQKIKKSVDAQRKELLAENKTLTSRVSTEHAARNHLKSDLDKFASNVQHLKTKLWSEQKLHAGMVKKHRFIRRLLWVLLSIIYYLIFAILYHVIFFRSWIAFHGIPSVRSHRLLSLWENDLYRSNETNKLPTCRSF